MRRSRKEKPGRLLRQTRLGPVRFLDPAVLCSALFWVLIGDAGGWLRLSLAAAVCHEAGHILAFVLLVRRFPQLDVTLTGFCLHTQKLGLPPRRELQIALAGPAVNFLLAACCRWRMEEHATVFLLGFMWSNLLTGAFNALPVPPLDGWTALQAAVLLGGKRE